jgi:hypothetical protein
MSDFLVFSVLISSPEVTSEMTPEERDAEEKETANMLHRRIGVLKRKNPNSIPKQLTDGTFEEPKKEGFLRQMWNQCKIFGLWLWDLFCKLMSMTYEITLTIVRTLTPQQLGCLLRLIFPNIPRLDV